MITVYPVIPDEKAYMGMSPRKRVEGSEFRFSTLLSGGYINIEKIHNMRCCGCHIGAIVIATNNRHPPRSSAETSLRPILHTCYF